MKHYVFVTDIGKKKLKEIQRDFKSVYHVDLDDKKYDIYDSLEKKWNAIVEDTFLERGGNPKEAYVQKFMQLFYQALYGIQGDIVGPYDIEVKKRADAVLELTEYIKEMTALIDDYEIYEPDVWLNAYLSIQYIKAREEESDEDIVPKYAALIKQPYYVEAGGVRYNIPFENYQEGFCENYKRVICNKKEIPILGAYIEDRDKEYKDCADQKEFLGYKKRVELTVYENMRYTRWQQGKVLSLEQEKINKIEDKIMFHKTINGIFVRNLADTMISTGHIYDVGDYLYLVDKLCMCKSLNWQNLIGCLYIKVSYQKQELIALNLWTDILCMFERWFDYIEALNRRLELMVEGLVYIIHKQDEFFEEADKMEERCEEELKKIEKHPISFTDRENKLIEKEWKDQKKDQKKEEVLKVRKTGVAEYNQYDWIYAIMQRDVIDGMAPSKCDKMLERDRDWDYIVKDLSSYYRMVTGSNIWDDMERDESEGENRNLIENNDGMAIIGEACYSLQLREWKQKETKQKETKQKEAKQKEAKQKETKQKENWPVEPEKLFNKEDLLNELERRLLLNGKVCDRKQILNGVVKMYVDYKAREKVLREDVWNCSKEGFIEMLKMVNQANSLT